MNSKRRSSTPLRGEVSKFIPGEKEAQVGRWRINGFGATLLVWTEEQWDRLEVRPIDAQYISCGVWCALRMDD
jgi:hypothetical protein